MHVWRGPRSHPARADRPHPQTTNQASARLRLTRRNGDTEMTALELAPETTPRSGVAERLTWILDAFVDGPEVMLLEEIAAETDLPRSTAFRLITQLVDLDWLEH